MRQRLKILMKMKKMTKEFNLRTLEIKINTQKIKIILELKI